MSAEKKVNFKDLDLSGITGPQTTAPAIPEITAPLYSLWGIPLAEITEDQFQTWLVGVLPVNGWGDKKEAFNTTAKKINIIEHVTKMYKDKTILFSTTKKDDRYRQ